MPFFACLVLMGCEARIDDPHGAALAAIAESDYPAARVYLQQALERHPDDDAVRLLYAETLLFMDNPQGAIAQLEQIIQGGGNAQAASVLLARAKVRIGEAAEALELLEERGMTEGAAYGVAIGAKLALGDADGALRLLDEGLAAYPNSPDLGVLNAQRAFDGRNLPLARTLLKDVLQDDPDHIEALLLAGRIAMQDRDFAAAESRFADVFARQPWNVPAHLAMASIARDAGDAAKADEWLAAVRQLVPSHPVGTYFAAQMAYDRGDVGTAQSLLNEIRKDAADFPALWLLRGLVASEQGNPNTAMTALERFFAQGGESEIARLALATLYANNGKTREGWATIAPALQSANASRATLELARTLANSQAPMRVSELTQRIAKARMRSRYDTQLRAAHEALRAGDWREADRVYSRILAESDVADAVVLNNAANARLQQGDASGAVALARRAFAAAPGDPFVLDTLGWSIYQSGGDRDEARALVRRAYTMAQGHPEIAAHWAALSSGN